MEVAWVDRLPHGVAALIATGDLQGREHFEYQTTPTLRLLGEWLPSVLRESVIPTLNLPAGDIGVLLAGDFYTVSNLDRRGGSGLVTSVWESFGQCFSWVVGVAGNHDTFGSDAMKPPKFCSPLRFLDCSTCQVAGLCFAGISGIVGNPRKGWRKTEDDFENYILSLAENQPDVLLMHDGPNMPELGYRGSPRIREALMVLAKPLVVRGHAHWKHALAQLPNGLQVLNVDARVVVLRGRA